MKSILRVVGALLLVLAAAKVVGLTLDAFSPPDGRPTSWFLKQAVYAVGFGAAGVALLRRNRTNAPPSASDAARLLPPFDFAAPLRLSAEQRIERSLQVAQALVEADGDFGDERGPVVAQGATAREIDALEARLGAGLPGEYRRFLTRCRRLDLDDGFRVFGVAHDGDVESDEPWVSDTHREGFRYLVVANYFRLADGDQLLIDLRDPNHAVVAYLHEEGPLFEPYAPSFSLALWRFVHEPVD
jgi:hypothetical protein